MLLGTKFEKLAENTVDYWMKGDEQLSYVDVESKLKSLNWNEKSSLQLYIHIQFCTQKCTFCAFSGGNAIDFNEAVNYVDYLKKQLETIYEKTGSRNKSHQSIHIGGGSPDILNSEIGLLLDYLVDLPGFTEKTELSIAFSLFSVRPEFLEQLGKYPITKVSFGVQSLNPEIRRYLKMPPKLRKLDEVCARLQKTIPVINVDLMTGFPNQTLEDALYDLEFFIKYPFINSISSYLFSQGAAPAFVADVISGKVPPPPTEEHHANLRLHSFAMLQCQGWKRFGTNTYIDPNDVTPDELSKISGNECLGAHTYDDFLIGIGASAVSYFPGLRLENKTDLGAWLDDVHTGILPYDLSKCSIEEQKDMALWGLPLNFRGLRKETLDQLIIENVLDIDQITAFEDYIRQGLIRLDNSGMYNITITGEVFQGHLVKGLKKKHDQQVITDNIQEGHELAKLVVEGKITDMINLNNRQQTINTKTIEN